MPRTARASKGGICYHVINRGNAKSTVYHNDADFHSFVKLMTKACDRIPMRVLSYCLMPNHFHLVLWPVADHDLGRWMQWLLTSHVRRYHRQRGTSGRVWQGRFKAFPIQQDRHLLTVIRYVERNPLRANLVRSADHWAWSSIAINPISQHEQLLSQSPVPRPNGWLELVNEPQSQDELDALRCCGTRNAPFGSQSWTLETAKNLGLESSIRNLGRPSQK